MLSLVFLQVQVFGKIFTTSEFFVGIWLPALSLLLLLVILFVFQKRISLMFKLSEKQTRSLRRVYIFLSAAIVVVFSIILANQFEFTKKLFASISDIFRNPFYQSDNTSVSLFTIFLLLVFIYFTTRISSWIRRASYEFIHKNSSTKKQKASAISRLMQYGFLFCFFVFGLPIIGIDLTSLSILLGVLGFGLGFGLQDLTANFFSGVTIGFSQTVSEGDRIAVDGIEGDIIKINFLNTEVRTITNENLVVPNKIIVTQIMHNHTKNDPHVLINSSVEVAYDQDIDLVESLLITAGAVNPYRIQSSPPVFRMVEFGESGIAVSVWIWVADVREKYAARSELNREVWRQFVSHKIKVPFPQRDIYIKNASELSSLINQETTSAPQKEPIQSPE